jgi:CHAT domain-containing protein
VPLHAAGHGQNWCSDYVVSSYAPTLTALLEARRDAPSITQTSARLLLASAAHYDHLPRLPNVPEEAANVVAVASPGAILQLKETEGNWKYGEEVLQRLPEANILHLACHGVQDYHYPLRSAFWLGRARIEIREILQLRLDNAFLAFLSACETVTGFDTLQDEVFHMGSAMLFTGFRSVVGTMWSVWLTPVGLFI